MTTELRCPLGHPGPFWYVEAIEVHRAVTTATTNRIVVEAPWETGEGFDEGMPDSGYLLCRWRGEDGIDPVYVEQLDLPPGVDPEFVSSGPAAP